MNSNQECDTNDIIFFIIIGILTGILPALAILYGFILILEWCSSTPENINEAIKKADKSFKCEAQQCK